MRRIHDHYKNKGLTVDGMVTREVRKGDERIGFKITDLSSGAEGWLARMGDSVGPGIGKYSVDSEDLEEIGVGALKRAAGHSADLVLVDEIGPMEMTSSAFRGTLAKLLSAGRNVIATVKYGPHYPDIARQRGVAAAVRLEISSANQ